MKLKKIEYENFKGERHRVIEFSDKTTILSGQNGSGKTTAECAYLWSFADVDSELNANPNVRPNGADDGIVTRVISTVMFGDKEVVFEKVQKVKTKQDASGKVKTTKTNSYTVNSVPKSQRDAFAYLEELGFDSERFLEFSHPDDFTRAAKDKKGRNGMRDALFGMTTDVSDKEVAVKAGLTDVAGLLDKYTKDEIVAMQNATKRKISQEYGKNGEVIDHKIDGLNAGKTEADGEAAKARREDLTAKIAAIEQAIADTSTADANSEFVSEINSLETEKRDHLEKISREVLDFNWNLRNAKKDCESKVGESERRIEEIKRTIVNAQVEIDRLEEAIKEKQSEYRQVKASVFDESKTVCPVCKRRYSEKKVAEMAANFEKDKADKLTAITEDGKKLSAQRDKAKENKSAYEAKLVDLLKELGVRKKSLADLPAEKVLVREDDVTRTLDAQISELKTKLQRTNTERKNELICQLASVREELNQAVAEIVRAENNQTIDQKIADLQKRRIEYEQARLDCEKILAQVSELEMRKNELLTEQINSHFRLVTWKLFDVQANGEILTDRCTPYIDGKELSECANHGLQVLAKLDVCDSLQRFYGQEYPIWVDNAESLTNNTTERFEVGSQLILLKAVEGKELEVTV